MSVMARDEQTALDLAIVGAGAAGTFVADAMQTARPGWSIELNERTQRVGGRLRSMSIPGIDHPIELGGMRFPSSHRRVAAVVDSLGLATRDFDTIGGTERSYLRGRFGNGQGDPASGAGYDLGPRERGRSSSDLMLEAFERMVPGGVRLDAAGWIRARATARFGDRPITEWQMADALASVLSADAHRFVVDAFGYDSGMRAFNVGDGIEFLTGGSSPAGVGRVPTDGMDRIPRALAERFESRGGQVRVGRELSALEAIEDGFGLRFTDGSWSEARRVVIATAIPALQMLADSSPVLGEPAFRRIIDSVEGFPAVKHYLWFERPWWRPGIPGIRLTTDLPARKLFYFDTAPDGPAALLATYTDGRHTEPWADLAGGTSDGEPAPAALLAQLARQLEEIHPETRPMPLPAGSAFQHWGADPHETAWTLWRPGVNSDDFLPLAPQPDPRLPLYLCGESFARAQGWVEGAFETAETVVTRLLASGT